MQVGFICVTICIQIVSEYANTLNSNSKTMMYSFTNPLALFKRLSVHRVSNES